MDTMTRTKLVVGSRESKLAVVQSNIVIDYLRENYPRLEVELLALKTTGDIKLDGPLYQIGGKGLFVKELDVALMERRSDISVHSLKDVPMEVSEELPLLGFSRREDERDALVMGRDGAELREPGEVGELWVGGPQVMRGYFDQPGETARTVVEADGTRWFRTGDLCSRDPDGTLVLHRYAEEIAVLREKVNT